MPALIMSDLTPFDAARLAAGAAVGWSVVRCLFAAIAGLVAAFARPPVCPEPIHFSPPRK